MNNLFCGSNMRIRRKSVGSTRRLERLEARWLFSIPPFAEQDPIATLEARHASSVRAADLDADGDQDVVFASGFGDDGKVGWYENLDGKATFGPQRVSQFDRFYPRNAFPVDMDSDRDLDIVYANQQYDVYWIENLGNRNGFGARHDVGVAGTPFDGAVYSFMDVADFDGDGDPDVAVPVRSDGNVVWFRNRDGRGNFDPSELIQTGRTGVHSVASADMDADGDMDLLSASVFDQRVEWHENVDGLGTFAEHHLITGSLRFPLYLAAGDLDQDGDVDVFAHGTDAAWLENMGRSETFILHRTDAPQGTQPDLLDLDQDGDLDVFAGDWLENTDGSGRLSAVRGAVTNANGLDGTAAADLDGDGDLDVLSSSRDDHKIAWYPNDGTGNFGPQAVLSHDAIGVTVVLTGDIDNDGDLDVVSASRRDNKIAWYENLNGLGSMGLQRVIANDRQGLYDIDLADLDGDGDLDVAATSRGDDVVAWYENDDGHGNFGDSKIVSRRPDDGFVFDAHNVTIFDVDGDSDYDFLWSSMHDETIAWQENMDGQGSFGLPVEITRVGLTESIHIVDMNRDGRSDLLATSENGLRVFLLSNGNFVEGSILMKGVRFFAASDLDRDTDIDIVSSGYTPPDGPNLILALYRQNETSSFDEPDLFQYTTPKQERGAASILTTDLDADGDIDVIAGGIHFEFNGIELVESGQVSVFENIDGNGTFGPQKVIGSHAGSINGLHAADIDGDGDLDILSANYTTSRIDWYRNDLPSKIAGDTNGDGQLTATDIDRFYAALRDHSDDPKFDLTNNQQLEMSDVDQLVEVLMDTSYGDANLDRRFDSSDLVHVFQRGQYEDGLTGNSSWLDGDWNGDQEFDTGDLVLAFQKGAYFAGPRPVVARGRCWASGFRPNV